MDKQDIEHRRKLLETLKERKYGRELQLAKLGVMADPIISMEIRDIEEQIKHLSKSFSQTSADHSVENPELDNLEEQSPLVVGLVSASNALGRGITLGGTYRNIPLRLVATRWSGYGMSWMRSGWLFVPQLTCSHAIAFFKLHVQDEGSGYIHIIDASDPVHTIWLTTGTGFKKEDQFHYINHPMAIWPFSWK
jgi:hypothetical protein